MAKTARHKAHSYRTLKPIKAVLEDLVCEFSNEKETPHLGIELLHESGEYWFFHPGLFNLKGWWNEIIIYSDIVRDSIIKSKAFYVHEKYLERIFEGKTFSKKRTMCSKRIVTRFQIKKGFLLKIPRRDFFHSEKNLLGLSMKLLVPNLILKYIIRILAFIILEEKY